MHIKFCVMDIQENNLYHIYNRGNNRQPIFFSERNYYYFLDKVKTLVLPNCSLMSYCLMPNHFHLFVHADERSVRPIHHNVLPPSTALGEGVRLLLSSYTKGINSQEGRTGSLFQQNTKCKPVYKDELRIGNLTDNTLYELDVFEYIHYNPVKAGLVLHPGDWLFSSFNEYQGLDDKNLCNKDLANRLFLYANKLVF